LKSREVTWESVSDYSSSDSDYNSQSRVRDEQYTSADFNRGANTAKDSSDWVVDAWTTKRSDQHGVSDANIDNSVKVDSWTGEIHLGSQWQVPVSSKAAHNEAGAVQGVASVWSRHSSNDDWDLPAGREDDGDRDDDGFVIIREDPTRADLSMSGARLDARNGAWW
jgi:hypothetical protein